MSLPRSLPDPLSVACTTCQSGVGVGCVTRWGWPRFPHYTRCQEVTP